MATVDIDDCNGRKPNRKTVIALMNVPGWKGTWKEAEQYIICNRRNGKFVMPKKMGG